uniref:Guanylate cyclase activator 2B n=1 Tax=Geotrypetes seraphini TaxID=260995 RepID=A0A6P8P292_GEOSA|nr:guanylin-like [Geotrypetes seraphini]
MKHQLQAACLVFLPLILASQAVFVQDGEHKIPLEAVKHLKVLSSGYRKSTFKDVCTQPSLPKDLVPVCKDKDAVGVFRRLTAKINDVDLCEICAVVACSGCK